MATAILIVCVLLAPDNDKSELIIEPIKIIPDKKEISKIVGISKSKRLIPPPEKPKKEAISNDAQIPVDEVDGLFNKDNRPMDVAIEGEYDPPHTNEPLPEIEEVISSIDSTSDMENRYIAQKCCLDYNQIETTTRRMMRGALTDQDIDIIAQMEGTDLFKQIEIAMTTTNLEKVRTFLNNI